MQVVVKFVQIKQRGLRAGLIVGGGRVLNEQISDGQLRLDGRIGHDGSEILLRIGRVGENRPARNVAGSVRGGDVITEQLSRRRDAAGDGAGPGAVGVGKAHRHGHFGVEHHAVMQRDIGNGVEARHDLRRDGERAARRRHVGRMRGAGHDRAEIICAGSVGRAGRRAGEISPADAGVGDVLADQLRLHQKIGVRRGDVQRLDRQHVVARLQPVLAPR